MSFGALAVSGRAPLYTRRPTHTTPAMTIGSETSRGRSLRNGPCQVSGDLEGFAMRLFGGLGDSLVFAGGLGGLAPPDQLVQHVVGGIADRAFDIGQRLGAAVARMHRHEISAGDMDG